MTKRYYFLYIVFFSFFSAVGQEVLSLEQAIEIGISNNLGLKVSESRIEAAKNEIYKANAGMIPTIDWNANFGSLFNQVNQSFVDGRVINRFGTSLSPNTNVALNWTIYDGRRMQVQYDRLNSNAQLSLTENKLLVQNTVSQIIESFYTIQRLQSTVKLLNTIIGYYNERLKITEERWTIGSGSKLDFLQSKTDLNTQLSNLNLTENQLQSAKIRLNSLLARELNMKFEVIDDKTNLSNYNLNELIEKANSKNQELVVLNKQKEILLLNEKEAATFKLPRVSLNSSFGYNFNKNNAGLIALNQSVGLNTGISATWRIFDGNKINRDIQASKIQSDIISKQKTEISNQINTEINTSFFQFENNKILLELENENAKIAQENLNISLEKFKLGASTILQLNEAQRSFDDAQNRLVNAKFNVKISELNLLRLTGELIR